MKRFLALIFALIMAISLVGCGKTICSIEGCENEAVEDTTYEEPYCSKHLANKKAYEIAKNAYDMINIVCNYSEWIGNDVVAAWRAGIYDKSDFAKKGSSDKVELLASKLNLSYYDTTVGTAAAYQLRWKGVVWETLSDEEKEESRTSDGNYMLTLEAYGNELFQVCVMSVIEGYTHNGYAGTAQSSLDLAKGYIKTLSQEYPDYIHYNALKEYYTAASSYFDFCMNPTGNFEQASNSNNDYQKQVNEYKSELEIVFED